MSDVNLAAQESASCQHDGTGRKRNVTTQRQPSHTATVNYQIGGFCFDNFQVWLRSDCLLNCLPIKAPVSLGPRTLHGGTLAPIEEAELNTSPVSRASHQAIQRIDLPNQVPLSQSSDCGIARHHPDRRRFQGHQSGARTHSCGRMRGFASRVTAPHDDNIIVFHVKHSLLSNAKTAEDLIQQMLHVDPAHQRIQSTQCCPEIFCGQFKRSPIFYPVHSRF